MSAPQENTDYQCVTSQWQENSLTLNENKFQENSSYHPKRSQNKSKKKYYLRENTISAMMVVFSFIHMWLYVVNKFTVQHIHQ